MSSRNVYMRCTHCGQLLTPKFALAYPLCKQARSMILSHRDVSVTFFGLGIGLGLTVTGLSLGLMKFWSRSHTFWSRGLKSIICSSSVMTFEVLTVFCVLLNLISGHYEYFTSRKSSSSSIIHRLLFQIAYIIDIS